jgi:eukaryotic-like serine/threonine-protein kinase
MTDLVTNLRSALAGAYDLERELGGGGMSRVFLANEVALGRRVVIKVLPADLMIDLSAERFAREIQLAAALQHPCIVPVLTAGVAGGVPFYTMPYVSGPTLRDRLRERAQLPVREAMDVLRDVASALAHAHAQHIVHRDIKPENILLSGGYAQVTDFGIARAISASRTATDIDRARITQAGLVMGSPTYMSPEQIAGDDGVDQRADIYALGCLAYEILAGVPPFVNATDPHLVLLAHVSEVPADVRTHRPDLPADIASIVMRSLEKNRALRPQSAEELVKFFRAPRSAPATRPPRKSVPVVVIEKIPRWAWYMTFTTAFAAVVVAIVAVWPRKPVEESIAVLPFANLSGDSTQNFFGDGIATDLTNALAEIPGLRVASRNSAFAFKGKSVDPREVGRQLDVTEVLEGSVRRTGAGLRINAMLVRTRDGKSRWTKTFDRPDSALFAVQDEITRSIARALHITLRQSDHTRADHASTGQASLEHEQ